MQRTGARRAAGDVFLDMGTPKDPPTPTVDMAGYGQNTQVSDEQCGTQKVDRTLRLAKGRTGMALGNAQHKQASNLAYSVGLPPDG